MNCLLDVAQLLVSSWVLGKPDGDTEIPTLPGVLDQALKTAYDSGSLPDWAGRNLHFVDSRVGLRCVELLEILAEAQDAELSRAPNPSYRLTEVQISPDAAKVFLERLDVSEEDGRTLGRVLREAADRAKRNLKSGRFRIQPTGSV